GENDVQKQLADGQVTATNESASNAADQAAKGLKRNGGDDQSGSGSGTDTSAPKTQYFVDNQGNYGIVENSGLVIKTYKATGVVTLSQDGHQIRIKDHQVEALQDGQWVALRDAHNFRLPKGLQVTSDGSVEMNGKQLVSSSGDVKVDSTTTVNTSQGKMTSHSRSSNKTVTVDAGDGQSTIKEDGQSTIRHNADGFTATNPDTGKPEFSYNCHSRQFQMDNSDGSTVDLSRYTGVAVLHDANGQTTTVGDDGTMYSTDAQGNMLFGIDSDGNVSFFDGTCFDSDGNVYDSDGDEVGEAWSGGVSADGAISSANAAVASALGIAANGAGDLNQSGALGSIDAALGALAQQYTLLGQLDVVAQLQSAQGNVEAAKSQIDAQVTASANTRAIAGTVSPELTKEIAASGISDPNLAAETVLRNHGYHTNSGSDPAAA
ncbi:MAG TPA: hypothetical protein V6C72_07025, partial [Chroococcales cyanobacterium]